MFLLLLTAIALFVLLHGAPRHYPPSVAARDPDSPAPIDKTRPPLWTTQPNS